MFWESDKPDIVIIDKRNKSVAVLELTCPAEHRIPAANNLKMEKYAHFETDHPEKNISVTPFEIGSHTGYVTKEIRLGWPSSTNTLRN